MEKFEGVRFFDSLMFDNEIEQFSSVGIFHDQIKLLWSLYNLVKLNDIWMPNHFQNMDLSCHPLNIIDILDLILFQYFDGYSFIRQIMYT